MASAEASKATNIKFFNVTSETDLSHTYVVAHVRRSGLNRWTCNCLDFVYRRQFRLRSGRYCKHIRHVLDSVLTIHRTPASLGDSQYKLTPNANATKTSMAATVRARFAEMFLLFGESRRIDGVSENEWRFTNSKGEVFTVYDSADLPADQVPGLFTFGIGAENQTNGNDFAIWLADQIYAVRLSAGQRVS